MVEPTNNQTTRSSGNTNEKLVVADPSKGVRVDAAMIAKRFRTEIKQKVAELKARGVGTLP